jgi:hypothetical protein
MSTALATLAARLVGSPYGRFVGIELDAIEAGCVPPFAFRRATTPATATARSTAA